MLSAFLKIACIVCSQRLESYSRLPKSNSDKKLLNGFFTIKGFFLALISIWVWGRSMTMLGQEEVVGGPKNAFFCPR